MINVIDNTCTIKGHKDKVTTELQIAAHFILEELNTLDKLILLYSLTDMINESIKERIDKDE